jgi:hypothetical protein
VEHKDESIFTAHGYDVWKSVVTGYTATKKPKTATKKELKRNNKIEMDFILEGLCDSTKDKVGQCSSAKELWDKIHNLYFKESHSITEPEHANQNKEDVEQNKKKYAHHVRQIQKKKIVKKA